MPVWNSQAWYERNIILMPVLYYVVLLLCIHRIYLFHIVEEMKPNLRAVPLQHNNSILIMCSRETNFEPTYLNLLASTFTHSHE